jgi:hypothetical protein
VTRILQDAGIEPRQEDEMTRQRTREAARERERQQAEADRLFAIADQLADQAERPNYQHGITAERAARIRERIGEDLLHDARARAQVPEPALQGADLDAEVGRLAEMFPDSAGPEPARWPEGEPAGAAAPAPDYYRSPAGSTGHRAACEAMREGDGSIGYGGYEIDNAAELAYDQYADYGGDAGPPDAAAPGTWDRYLTSQPGRKEHKAAHIGMHREAGGEGFGHPDPDRSHLTDHGYQTDAGRWAMPEDYHGAPAGSAEADRPGPGPGPDSARWSPGLVTGVPARGGSCASVGCDCDYGHPDRQHAPESDPAPDPLPRVLEPRESAAAAPDPTQLPDGIAHPNPFLAGQGWATQGGWYVRQPELEHQLEAG